jgi:hypothetical protein
MKHLVNLLLPVYGVLTACSSSGENDEAACAGILLSAPESGEAGSGSFTASELMAHSAAMGMTQEEAETLLYLEGISPSDRLAPGESVCIDGKR